MRSLTGKNPRNPRSIRNEEKDPLHPQVAILIDHQGQDPKIAAGEGDIEVDEAMTRLAGDL